LGQGQKLCTIIKQSWSEIDLVGPNLSPGLGRGLEKLLSSLSSLEASGLVRISKSSLPGHGLSLGAASISLCKDVINPSWITGWPQGERFRADRHKMETDMPSLSPAFGSLVGPSKSSKSMLLAKALLSTCWTNCFG
jgi:hypothetical protein